MEKQKVTKELHSLLKDVNKSIVNESGLVYNNSQRTPEELIKLYSLKLEVLRMIEYSNLPIGNNIVQTINTIPDSN